MTIINKIICDSCKLEETTSKLMIGVMKSDGSYLHIHPRCIEKNISQYLANQTDTKDFIDILFGNKSKI